MSTYINKWGIDIVTSIWIWHRQDDSWSIICGNKQKKAQVCMYVWVTCSAIYCAKEACPTGLHHSGFSCGNHQPNVCISKKTFGWWFPHILCITPSHSHYNTTKDATNCNCREYSMLGLNLVQSIGSGHYVSLVHSNSHECQVIVCIMCVLYLSILRLTGVNMAVSVLWWVSLGNIHKTIRNSCNGLQHMDSRGCQLNW